MVQPVSKPSSFPAYRRSHFRSQTYLALVRLFSHFPATPDNGSGRIEQEKLENGPKFPEFASSASVDPKDPVPEKITQEVHDITEGVGDKGRESGTNDVVLRDIDHRLRMVEVEDHLTRQLENKSKQENDFDEEGDNESSHAKVAKDHEAIGESQEQGEKRVTQEEVMRLLEGCKGKQAAAFDLNPPYPEEIARKPYPMRYQVPIFRKFDGSGSAREHLMSFVDDLGIYRENMELRMKEFSKSLTGRAFTWYTKLRPRSIHTWEELATEFCNKFLEEEGVIHAMDLGKVKQRSNEGLTTFIKRYRDKALQCKETLPEADLVYGCIQNIEGEAQLFLSIRGITTFSELLKQAANISESLRRQGKRLKEVKSLYEVHTTKSRSNARQQNYDDCLRRFEQDGECGDVVDSRKRILPQMEKLPSIPLPINEVHQLVEQWLNEGLLEMKARGKSFTEVEKKNPEFCLIHESRTHGLRDCHLKRLFYKLVKKGRLILPDGEETHL